MERMKQVGNSWILWGFGIKWDALGWFCGGPGRNHKCGKSSVNTPFFAFASGTVPTIVPTDF